ncbi:MAG: epoxyqueuosine reductase [Anaerolineae bacterium]|jgi:epoxyqueuosine reductase QueG
MDPVELEIERLIRDAVAAAGTVTQYREPLVGFARADHPRFRTLRDEVSPIHLMPEDLVPGAQTIISFFLPFAPWVVEANARSRESVAREWARAYVETNSLIGRISTQLVDALAGRGIAAAAEPATHNFDEVTLHSPWSHKSVAVIAGLGSFGLHQMVITDAGCAGRFGSVVLDAELSVHEAEPRERCLAFYDGSCLECVVRCPASAVDAGRPLDKHRCHEHLHGVGRAYEDLGLVDVCGKCAIGPCSFGSAVPPDPS